MGTENFLTIDDMKVDFKPGETILETARRHGIPIPTLCHIQGLEATGACRVCVVEVKGARNLVASCAAPAAGGMEIYTRSPRVLQARKVYIELLLSSGHHYCATCEASGDCRLQDLAYEYKVESLRFPESPTRYPVEENDLILRDFSKCVMCGRCVQACNEIQVNQAISFGYRGVDSKIVTAGDFPYSNSDCVFCGECVQVCPVGALIAKPSRFSGKPWEVEKVRTTCPYCGVGCQMDLHVKDNRVVKITGAEDTGPNHGSLCVKGRFGFDFIHDPHRLKRPLVRKDGVFHETSWDEALSLVVERLRAVKEASGPDAIGVFSSARITNEENYIAQKFARATIGTNNVDHCARL
jgi:predicted molibdopterin-dependent oxidoreductase YjgC